MDQLAAHNEVRRREIEAARDRRLAAFREAAAPPAGQSLSQLEARMTRALSERGGLGLLELQVDVIERARHGGDLAIKVPQLLRRGGPKLFIRDHLPWIVAVLSGEAFADAVAAVATQGMYINLTLTDRWLIGTAEAIADAGEAFGRGDVLAGRTVVVDYSSPNVAKTLHAGHIRSTIIGHVLSNLYEACGALVYRVNHINDFGGFGFTLEGWRRFAPQLAELAGDNDRLLEIYRIRRTAERVVKAGTAAHEWAPADRAVLARAFPGATTALALAQGFADFTSASDARFAALESGDAVEVALWRAMVGWSLADFDRFYDSLNIRFSFTVGESFYFSAGAALVERLLGEGKAVVFTPELAEAAVERLDARLARNEIAKAERDTLAAAARKDVGAVVVPLDRDERLVVLRADGRSIYATRDLGAFAVRRDIFAMNALVYVVGQEQQVHFDRLFRAFVAAGLTTAEETQMLHLYFGFYVDAHTGAKLSSRDSVSNVGTLLGQARAYFRSRLSDRADAARGDLDEAARELAIGSLVFNDLKQDIKGPVEIDTNDLATTIAGFEKSGAAYVVYAACRARSILRRHGREPERADTIAELSLDAQEVALLLALQQIPQRIALAARQSNPSVLIRQLLHVATIYNSWYMQAPVLSEGTANPARLLITKAVQVALVAGLALAHVTCPEAI